MWKGCTMRIAAVILAAGYSSRMGQLKALLPLGDETILEAVVSLFARAGIEDIVVVSGYEQERIIVQLAGSPARVVCNPDFAQGMFSSVKTGIAHLGPKTEAFFLLPVDIPLVQPETLQALIAAWQATGSTRVVHPRCRGRRGHPPLIPACHIPAILEWAGEDGLRGFWRQLPEEPIEVEAADENILFDIDTAADYELLLEKFSGSKTNIPFQYGLQKNRLTGTFKAP